MEWTALSFTRLDAPGYEKYCVAQGRRWWSRFKPRSRQERFIYEIDHLHSVLGEALQPIGSFRWCVEAEASVDDSALDYYARVAMEMCT